MGKGAGKKRARPQRALKQAARVDEKAILADRPGVLKVTDETLQEEDKAAVEDEADDVQEALKAQRR
eukprot:3000903-Prorocentrum_lima.AAC.1